MQDQQVEVKTTTPLSQRSAKSEWKAILVNSIIAICVTLALSLWIVNQGWDTSSGLGKVGIYWLPFLGFTAIFSFIWAIRSARHFISASEIAPMAEHDYFLLRRISGEDNDGVPRDRLTRWATGALMATAGYGLQAPPYAELGISLPTLLTFWLPVVLYICAAAYAFEVTLFLLALSVIAATLWGISHLSISLAIILGAGLIALAVYARGRS